ncbi:MAG: DUF5808 domain-containing protein [Phycisphaerales bacterium]
MPVPPPPVQADPSPNPDRSASDPVLVDDPWLDQGNWVGGMYRSPQDPRLFVPQQVGSGWTVNFSYPIRATCVLGAMLALTSCPVLLAMLVFGGHPKAMVAGVAASLGGVFLSLALAERLRSG